MGDFNISIAKCRICLRDEKFQIPIFGEAGKEMQIFHKIKTCLPIQISEDDIFSKYICYKCLASLDHSYNLWKQSSESEALVRSLTSTFSQDLPTLKIKIEKDSKSSRAMNRTIMLASGTPINLDSDEEEETQPNNITAHMWPEGGDEDDVVMMDSSPDFLDSLVTEENERDLNGPRSPDNLPQEYSKNGNVQRQKYADTDISPEKNSHSIQHMKSKLTTANRIPSTHSLKIPSEGIYNMQCNSNMQLTETKNNQLSLSTSTTTASNSSTPHSIPDLQMPRMNFQTSSSINTLPNMIQSSPSNYMNPSDVRLGTIINASIMQNYPSPTRSLSSVTNISNLQPCSTSSAMMFRNVMSDTNLHMPSNTQAMAVSNTTSSASLDNSTIRSTSSVANSNAFSIHPAARFTSDTIPSQSSFVVPGETSKSATNDSNLQPPSSSLRFGSINNASNCDMSSSPLRICHFTSSVTSPALPDMNFSNVLKGTSLESTSVPNSIKLRSVNLFQMSPDSWRKFLKK